MSGDSSDRQESGGERTGNSPSLGEVLKTARSARGLTLELISTELRIEAQQLQALEQDQFERIGAPVFVKGYLRHYGQRLGLNYADLLGLYHQQVADREVVVQPSRSIKLRDERQITVWIIAAVVLAALIGLMVWWVNESGLLGAASNVGSGTAAARSERETTAPQD